MLVLGARNQIRLFEVKREHTDRGSNGDLHGHLRRGDNSVVNIGHESRVHSCGELDARSVECRLGHSVVV